MHPGPWPVRTQGHSFPLEITMATDDIGSTHVYEFAPDSWMPRAIACIR